MNPDEVAKKQRLLSEIAKSPDGFQKLGSMMGFALAKAFLVGLLIGMIFGFVMGYLVVINL